VNTTLIYVRSDELLVLEIETSNEMKLELHVAALSAQVLDILRAEQEFVVVLRHGLEAVPMILRRTGSRNL
jgi:hypothetical protein